MFYSVARGQHQIWFSDPWKPKKEKKLEQSQESMSAKQKYSSDSWEVKLFLELRIKGMKSGAFHKDDTGQVLQKYTQ